MTGGACAAAAAGVFQMEPEIHCDIEQGFGKPMAFVRQFAGFEFKGLVSGKEGHLGHPSIVAGCSLSAYNRGVTVKLSVLFVTGVLCVSALDLKNASIQLRPGAA